MISLVRLAYPHRWEDVERIFPGVKRWKLQRCFYWFLDFYHTVTTTTFSRGVEEVCQVVERLSNGNIKTLKGSGSIWITDMLERLLINHWQR